MSRLADFRDTALDRLTAPEPAALYRWFRVVFGLKLWCVALLRHGTLDLGSAALVLVLLAAVVNLGARRRYLPGAAVFAVYSLWVVVARWPFPINHHFFEALVPFVMLLLPAPEEAPPAAAEAGTAEPVAEPPATSPGGGWVSGLPVHVLQYAILSLFVFSGLQKVVHAHYLDGELFVLHALYTPDFLGDRLRDLLGAWAGGALLPWPGGYAGGAVEAAPGVIGALWALSVVVVAMEIAAPLLVAFRRTRWIGLPLLVALQLGIAASSYEIGIALVSLACIFLFLRRGYRIAYPLLALAILAYYAAFLLFPEIR